MTGGGVTRGAARAACLVALAGACGGPGLAPASPQLVVFIDTDALVRSQANRRVTVMDAPPLFDRVQIDGVHLGAACASCTRQFDVFHESFASREVSFGVAAPLVAGDAVRVRLYPSAYASLGSPPPEATIDVTATLPALPAAGVADVTLVLETKDVGRPTTGALVSGRPARSRVGTWADGARVDCGAPPHAGELCVPGGAFWMGNPLVSHLGSSDGDHLRLVVLSPFYVDAREVTVAEYRRVAAKIGLGEIWSGKVGCDPEDYCTFTIAPGPNDALPMSCVYHSNAVEYCAMQGKELPTEAQFEYLASGLASQSFVWGEDEPACADTILERGGLGYFRAFMGTCLGFASTDHSCGTGPAGGLPLGGPEKAGSGARDWLELDTPSSRGKVYDLVGNVSELARDAWVPLGDPCWATPGVYRDPVCDVVPTAYAIRGADWTSSGSDARAATRNSVATTQFTAQVGFRCVRALR